MSSPSLSARKIWKSRDVSWNHFVTAVTVPQMGGKQNNIVICCLRKFMSRCEIAAVWFGYTRMKTEEHGAEEGWKRRRRRGTPWTDWLHRAVLALFLPRKQSSRCSLAVGVSLSQQWSQFNGPSIRERMHPAPPFEFRGTRWCAPRRNLSCLIAYSEVKTINVLSYIRRWRVEQDQTAN